MSPIAVMHELHANKYAMFVSGSNDPPGQFVPPPAVPIVIAAIGPPTLLTTGGLNIGPFLYILNCSRACAFSSGVQSIRSFSVTNWREYAGGFVGNGCVLAVFSNGTSLCEIASMFPLVPDVAPL